MYYDRQALPRVQHKSTVEVKTNYFVKSVFIKQNISSGKIDYKIIVTSNNLAKKWSPFKDKIDEWV